MRILVATDQWFPHVRGGVARIASETSERLAALGHEVTAIVPAQPGFGEEVSERGVRLVRSLRRNRLPKTLVDPRDTAAAARALGGTFDVLVGHNSTTATGLLRAGLDAPLVTVFHASASLELEFLRSRLQFGWERGMLSGLAPALKRYERLSLDTAARILLLSEFSRTVLARQNAPAALRAVRVPAGVDTDVFSPGDRAAARARLGVSQDQTLVLTVRRLVPRMGLEDLIDASADLHDVPRLRVVIAGSGPERETLERRCSERGVGGRLQLLGAVADDDLVDWYRAADLFVLPTVAYEGFGLVTAEALACGTPVVGTPIGATPELLRPLDERLVSNGANASALAETIRETLKSATPELRARCRAYALERFSWGHSIEAWAEQLSAAAATPRERRRHAAVRVGRALDERVPFDLKGARNGIVAGGREATGLAVRVTGLPAVARRVHADRRAGILLYHSPTLENLERHLDYLSRRHAFVSYDAIATAVATGDWSNVPPKSLAVTFDDGHASNAGLIELLERFGIRPTIFICTEIVGTRRRFWWNVDGLDPRERDRLMKIPDAERLAFLEGRSGWTPTRDYDGEAQTLTLEQIAALAERVDFQAHTRSHPILPMCADHQAEDEIAGSKRDVERLRDGPCLDFAYPNGRYGRRELELVARAGFRSARTIRTGWNDPYTDPYQLRVIGMPDNASLNVVAAQSTGIRGLRELMYIS